MTKEAAPGREELVSEEVAVRRLGAQRRVGAVWLLASAATVAGAFAAGSVVPALVGIFGLLAGATTLAMARRDPGVRSGSPGAIRIEHETLFVRSAIEDLSLPLEDLTGGWIEEGTHGTTLVFQARGNKVVTARVDSEQREQAQALLAAAGVDGKAVAITVGQTSANTRGCASGCLWVALLVGLPWPLTLAWALVMLLLGESWGPIGTISLFGTVLVVIGVVLSLRALQSTTVTIGSDGVMLARLWRRRFVTFRQLDDARSIGREVQLVTGADKLTICCQNDASAQALVARVQSMGLGRESADAMAEAGVLARAGRSAEAWRVHLLGLLQGGSGYREQALRRADLWNVLEDAGASPEQRAGAALVLSRQVGDTDRDRLRVVAQGCAQAPLRLALAEAADGELELEAIEEAMAAHEAELDGGGS